MIVAIFLLWLSSFLVNLPFIQVQALTKVVVPSIHHEFQPQHYPRWMNHESFLKKFDYSVFLYQKSNPELPNYLKRNRGTEAGVYLNYIVDHYHNFPDVAIFVHGHPEHHTAAAFPEMLGCISPNASYISLNSPYISRDTQYWNEAGLWVEQCWRDILKVIWGLEDDIALFEEIVPIDQPISINMVCCQQFLISRSMVHRRPLKVWKKLLSIVYEQDVCHIGEPDYEHLYAFHLMKLRLGPEEPSIKHLGEEEGQGYGAHTQGGAMEHLAHVIYGHKSLQMAPPTMDEICQNFLPDCPNSPCTRSSA